ncbi:MAG: hypothetical protein P4N59_22575 [Negativicutes bacterium]|nr:hypothetical protein [Negativicutes bacterium]
MREVRKKSADSAVNQLLVKAYKEKIDLAWDRADAMQPQCGFARLALCCTDCQEGPCRVNPFGAEEQAAICGRDRHDLVAATFLKKVAGGTAALVRLAGDFGGEMDIKDILAVMQGDAMSGCAELGALLAVYGKTSAVALQAIDTVKAGLRAAGPQAAEVNLGVLKAGAVNVVVYGHVAPDALLALAKAANAARLNLVTMCGNEGSGSLNLPVLTNYDSQEAPLLSGAVDLLVIGEQCVMPAAPILAGRLGIPVVVAGGLKKAEQVKQGVDAAQEHFAQRAGKNVDIPETKAAFQTNYTAANSAELIKTISNGYTQGKVRGLVYLGGCGNISVTQDAHLVKLAGELISQGYVVVTAGCAGTALAKAGLCSPAMVPAGLKAILPANTPAVLHIGSCHDAATFLAMAQSASESGTPVCAVLPELVHDKTLATAVAFATKGLTVFAEAEWLYCDAKVARILGEDLKAATGGAILPLGDFATLQLQAEVAAAK